VIEWLRGAGFARGAAGDQVAAPGDPLLEVAGRARPVAIRRHPRARRLTMRLSPGGDELRITLPTWGRTADALRFARSRASWIEAQLARLAAPAPPIGPGAVIVFRGEPLLIDWQAGYPRAPRHAEGVLALGGPQDRIAPRIQRWMEGEALTLLAADLAHYCARADQPVPALRLSRAQRRWGSCACAHARAAIIRINWRLVMAPDIVRRSVAAHEVAHLTHFDHSPAFHAHLAALFGADLAQADLWLKQHGRSLYQPFG